jgi:hypothetical protein
MTCYKLGCLAVGSIFSFLGYRLFQSGIWGKAGDLDAKFKDFRLVLKSGAPGTFFAVLGAVIVVFTVWQGLSFNLKQSPSSGISRNTAPPLPEPKGLNP